MADTRWLFHARCPLRFNRHYGFDSSASPLQYTKYGPSNTSDGIWTGLIHQRARNELQPPNPA
jgi:hypothetical protein